MNFIDVEKSSPISELVIQHNTYGSTVNIYDNKLTKETLSLELEAIIVINADKRSLFEKIIQSQPSKLSLILIPTAQIGGLLGNWAIKSTKVL